MTKWKEWDIDWGSIDLILAGSPCQGFSFVGKQLAFDDPRSKLFFVFVDILKNIQEFNPEVKFLLENVRMKKTSLEVISETLGVEPVFINSKLVSAQSRPRYYWANWGFPLPENGNAKLVDILELEVDPKFTISENFNKRVNRSTDVEKRFTVLNPEIAACMTARQYANWKGNLVDSAKGQPQPYRTLTPVECERLQTVPDNYTAPVAKSHRYKMLGNGWTVDVVAHILKPMIQERILGDLF